MIFTRLLPSSDPRISRLKFGYPYSMWVVPIVLPIVLLVVPLGLQVLESRLVRPFPPLRSDIPTGPSAGVALDPIRPMAVPTPVDPSPAPTGGPRPSTPRLRAVPHPAAS
jgi:hypothetical protein